MIIKEKSDKFEHIKIMVYLSKDTIKRAKDKSQSEKSICNTQK